MSDCGARKPGRKRASASSCVKPVRETKATQARRRKLLEASRSVFYEKGYAATTVDDIMALTGGSRGTLYLYFGSKLSLFETIVRDEAERVFDALDEVLSAADGGFALEDVAEQIFLFATDARTIALLRTVIAERLNFPEIGAIYHAVASTVREKIRALFRRCQNLDSPVTSDFLADLFIALVISDNQMAILTGTVDEGSMSDRKAQITAHLSMLVVMSRAYRPDQ